MKQTDANLRHWADEHLVYEAQMLRYAADRLQALGRTAGAERNTVIEGFAIHARCLREFLWHDDSKKFPEDARAVHFCAAGAWNPGDLPPFVAVVHRRVGEEIVHVSYRRQGITHEAKGWNYDAIYRSLAAQLRTFADVALPERIHNATRRELRELAADRAARPFDVHDQAIARTAVATSGAIRPSDRAEPGTIRVRSSEPPETP